ncbi:hypothetical protein BC830DRAFT_1130988 [Chytriomyces sp. MP71]|nr:hypothetical protein BC830DRAFT_1130988 [Chytriomyces sp. MP71]
MPNRFVTTDLFAKASLTASVGQDDVYKIKSNTPMDEAGHSTLWAAPSSCTAQTITADWSSLGPYSVSDFSIMNGPQKSLPQSIWLYKSSGEIVEASNYMNCIDAIIPLNGQQIDWFVCRFVPLGDSGVYDSITSAKFVFNPALIANGKGCQLSLYEMTLNGVPTPGLSAGAIGGITVACVAFAAGLTVLIAWCQRRRTVLARVKKDRDTAGFSRFQEEEFVTESNFGNTD